MTRRTGERPIIVPLDRWSPDHPVARAIATGDTWFGAWQRQKATTFARLTQLTGIPVPRLTTIDQGGPVSRAEVDALARAWSVSAADLIASMPVASPVVE